MESKGNLTTGILIGIGLSVTAYFFYMKNKDKVDDFLRSQGITIPESASEKAYANMNLEELVSTKEQIEDLIAEAEHKMSEARKAK